MTLSYRTARLVVLGAWTVLFAYLWVSGETTRYLGTRTAWAVPFGALALAAATVLYGRGSRGGADARRPLSRRELGGTLAMLSPVVVVFVLAHASLGALAASHKLAGRGIDASRLAAVAKSRAVNVSFLELETAATHPGYAKANDIVPGRPLTLEGMVLGPAPRAGARFRLGRFYITCCVADSIPIDATVEPDPNEPSYRKDQWLRVTGRIVRDGHGLALKATAEWAIREPRHPYLDFTT